MKKLELLSILFVVIFAPIISLAAWTAPTEQPPRANTEPPINIGGTPQYKRGTLGAYELCLYTTTGKKITPCLSGGEATPINFPWIRVENNLENTNTAAGNIYIKDGNASNDWIFSTPERLTVEGRVKALGLCLGNSCVNVTGNNQNSVTTYNANNWGDLITQLGGGVKKIIAGSGIAISPSSGIGDVTVSLSNKPDPFGPTCTVNQVLQWNGTKWICANVAAGGDNVSVHNTYNTTNPVAGTVNRMTKFTASDKIGDSKMIEDGNFIKNDIPINTSGGLIIENRTDDNVPTNQIGRIWFRTDL